MDMDIYMDIHVKSVDMDTDMNAKFHIHGKPGVDWRVCGRGGTAGAPIRSDRTCTVDPEADPAVRDPAGPARHDASTYWRHLANTMDRSLRWRR